MPTRISRRRFVQSTAMLAGAPYFIPSSALGKDGHVAPSERIALAHIGVGGQGSYHLNFNSRHKDVRVVAVCDLDKRHVDNARNVLKGAYGSDSGIDFLKDFRQLVDRKDIDACLIAIPDHWHALVTLAMLKSGKDVYCEKPLTRTVVEGRKVADTVKRYGRVLQTGSQEHSNPNARYVTDIIRNGYLGDVKKVEVIMPVTNHGPLRKQPPTQPPPELDYNMWLGPAPEKPYFFSDQKDPTYHKNYERCHFWFRYQLDYATGEMSDRGAHMLDLVQFATGNSLTGPVEVSGVGQRDVNGEFDSFMKYDFRFRYANGVQVHGTSEGTDETRGITYHGAKGWINYHVHGGKLTASDPSLLEIKLKPGEETVGLQGRESTEHHQSFYDAVRSRGEPTAPAEVGHRSATVCHITTIATLLGRPLKWDPAKEKFIGDEEANGHLGRKYREPWVL